MRAVRSGIRVDNVQNLINDLGMGDDMTKSNVSRERVIFQRGEKVPMTISSGPHGLRCRFLMTGQSTARLAM
jgi:hypothetical protein